MKVKIEGDFIKLDQLLKYAEIAGTGGHAKVLIQEGFVLVNNEFCYQRGKKIRPGDIVNLVDEGGDVTDTIEIE